VSAEVRLAETRPGLDRDRGIDRLIACAHATLGRHRGDDGRQGALSGDDARPTAGGLRIGKPLPERRIDEAFDERLEWERDGQYFHYLTKWIHALLDVSDRRDDVVTLRWARDLAEAACEAFIERDGDSRPVAGGAMSSTISSTISWKRSIDLRRVLVPGGGTLDPLDGLATVTRVATACARRGLDIGSLGSHLDELASICTSASGWATADPLGIGGVIGSALGLLDALAEPAAVGDRSLRADLVDFALLDARAGLEVYERSRRSMVGHRPGLAFRELGLAEGLHRARRLRDRFESTGLASESAIGFGIDDAARRESISASLAELTRFDPLGTWIERHWIEASRRGLSEWRDHLDINEISLASSLLQRAR
jgi:hypothetical protein